MIKEAYGVMLVDPKTQKVRLFGDALMDLSKAMENMPPAEKTAKLFSIFGKIGGRAVAAIMANNDALDEMRVKVRDNVGFAAAFVEKLMDSLYGSFEKMKSAVQNLGTSLGKALAPAIGKLFTDITRWANKLEKQPGLLKEWGEYALETGKNILYVAFALKAMGAVLSISALGFHLWEGADKVWIRHGDRISELAGRFKDLAVVIGKNVWKALLKLSTLDLVKVFNSATGAIKSTATAIYTKLVAALSTATTGTWTLNSAFTALKVNMLAAFTRIGAAWSSLWAIITGTAAAGVASVLVLLSSVVAAALSVGYALYKAFKYFMDKDTIAKEDAYFAKMKQDYEDLAQTMQNNPLSVADASSSYKKVVSDMVRRRKTQEEINTYLSEQQSILETSISSTKALLKQTGMEKSDRALILESLQMQEARLKGIKGLVAAIPTPKLFDSLPSEDGLKRWEDYYSDLKKLREKYDRDLTQRKEDDADAAAMDYIKRLSGVSPAMAGAALVKRKISLSVEREEALAEFKFLEAEAKKIVDDELFDKLGMGEDAKKAQEERVQAVIDKLKRLDDALRDVGKSQRELQRSRSLNDINESAIASIQSSRGETLRQRAFSEQMKNDPAKAIETAATRMAQIQKALVKAQEERLAAEIKAKDGTEESIRFAELRADEEQALYKELYGAQDDFAAAKEAMSSPSNKLEEMSIGFWGSQNPLEMLGGGTVKVEQKMLAEAQSQTKLLGEIKTKLAPYGHFY